MSNYETDTWKRVGERADRKEAIEFARKLRKQGHSVRIVNRNNRYIIESKSARLHEWFRGGR